jgi:hypothetical protein
MNMTEPQIVSTPRARARAAVSIRGRLDRAGIARLRTELAGWRTAGAHEVRLHLSEMTSYAPGLARTLAWAQTQLRENGSNLRVIGAPKQLQAELRDAVDALGSLPSWHAGGLPQQRTPRPETADQP